MKKAKSSELLLSSQAKYIQGSTEDRKIAHEAINSSWINKLK